MPGIPRNLAEHSLKVHKDARPVKQAMRRFSGPKRDEISREIDRLLNAKFIREIKDSGWVANPVLVEKKKTTVKPSYSRSTLASAGTTPAVEP